MFYKLSMLASRGAIEKKFSLSFKYPNLYNPRAVISGLNESQLPIITSLNDQVVNFGIWGLLPEEYLDDWNKFQAVNNTLNINWRDLQYEELPSFFNNKLHRCLVLVSGIFTNKIEDGELLTYHVHLKNHEPFALAGVFNILRDGFYTCAPVIIRETAGSEKIPNSTGMKPWILSKSNYNDWLNPESSFKELDSLLETPQPYDFQCHQVKEEFYQDDSLYSKIIESSNFNIV